MSTDPKNEKTNDVELSNDELEAVSGGDIPVIPPKAKSLGRDVDSTD